MSILSARRRPLDPTPHALLAGRDRREWRLFILVSAGMAIVSLALILIGATSSFATLAGVVGALVVAGCVARWPVVGFYVVGACTVTIEQEPLKNYIFTDRLHIFYWPSQLAGFIERPIGFLILFSLLAIMARRLARREPLLHGGKLIGPLLVLMVFVAGAAAYGLATGGDVKIVVLEVRPFWYLFLSYLLAYNLVRDQRDIRVFLWIGICGAAVKSAQGAYLFFALDRSDASQHIELMAHEESFFFVALILLVILFAIRFRYRAQLIAALLVMPWLLIALIGNDRRADYLALLVAAAVAWVLVIVVYPKVRGRLILTLVVVVLLLGAYVGVFYQASGAFARPAHAVVAIFKPEGQEASSNLYRTIEDYDLKYTAKKNPLGLGFGKPFQQPIALPNILSLDPYYLYIPHNTIYWVWMRMGFAGLGVLLYLFGSLLIRGVQIARSVKHPYLQVFAIYVVGVTLMEVIVAYADYQLFFYRNVIYLGLLAGILLKLPAIDAQERADEVSPKVTKDLAADEATRRLAERAPALLGR